MTVSAVSTVERSVAAAAAGERSLVLAVSGGLDSMALLEAVARVARRRIAVVATFDHGSGPHAARAAAFVCREAAVRGLPVVVGHAEGLTPSESAWREARWRFLREVARSVGSVIVTAHTEDDQLETAVMRALRGAGARGLAGLYAASPDVVRPFVGLRRAVLDAYVAARAVGWIPDPSNADRRYFRNRVRLDILPALLQVRPTLDRELLDMSRRAAELRTQIDAVAEAIVNRSSHGARPSSRPREISVAEADLEGYDAESLALLWPAIAARAGLALDRRGTQRLAAFTNTERRTGASMQLAGGWEVVRDRHHLTLRRTRAVLPAPADLPPTGALRWGRWSFVRERRGGAPGPWHAVLPSGCNLVVRAWQPGDRMVGSGGTPRRVKRFFGDAGIIGPDRAGWPVVLAGEEIVWIPGVGRSRAAAGSSETPGLIYSCELNDR